MNSDFVLLAFAKSLEGTSGGVGSGGGEVSVEPASIAVGNGTTAVTSSDTALDSELFRRAITSVARVSGRVTYSITLASPESVPKIACLGLFGPDGGSGSLATGSLTIGGTPAANSSILLTFAGVALTPYFCSGAISTGAAAIELKDHLLTDDTFKALYTATVIGSVITVTSLGKGTIYNKTIAAQVGGGITCSASGVSGGATPGGQLLAATNCSRVKTPGRPLLIEWSINVTN